MTGPRWLRVRVDRPPPSDQDELWIDAIVRSGAAGVLEEPRSWTAWLPDPPEGEAFADVLRQALRDVPGGRAAGVSVAWQEHEAWAETWKRGLAPRRVSERLVVSPTWEEAEVRPGDVLVRLDPGMAFGTAEHGTTRGCLRLVDRFVRPGDRVLDVGSGTGILAVAAALLGAGRVLAVEGDPLARDAFVENVATNGGGDRIRLETRWADADWLSGLGTFDLVLANLERGLLEPLLNALVAAVGDRGTLVVSGLFRDEGAWGVAELHARGLETLVQDVDEEWTSIAARAGAVRRRALPARPGADAPGSAAPRGPSRTSG